MSAKVGRQRVSLACTACRTRRTRCDGQLPECGACTRTGKQCEYPHSTEKRKPPTKRYIEALQARIESLERQLQTYQQQNPPTTSLETARGSVAATDYLDFASVDNNSEEESPNTLADREPVDDLAEIAGQLEIAEDGHLRYFGAASYFNLLRRNAYVTARNPSQDAYSVDAVSPQNLIVINLPFDTQLHLLELFWKWQNPWQYLVHRTAFQRAVERGTYDDYCSPLLLHCVLALAARYCDHPDARLDPDDANTAGDLLAIQAKEILRTEIEHPSTSTAAALAILALREMAVNKESLGWIYIGIAVRIAYNLGLNLDCQKWVHQQKITEEEAEIRRITWWGCYLLDKLFNIGLGRPSMIRERDITAAKPSLLKEEEFLPWMSDESGLSAELSASRSVSNLRYMTNIFQTACPTLDKIYSPNTKLSLTDKQEMAAKSYLDLVELYSKLPSFLKLPNSVKTARPAHIYSLHLQYHTVLILLHRPFLCRQGQHQTFDGSSSLSHNHICTSSAEAISNVVRAYRSNYTLRRIPISTVHALGTASVILLLNATSHDTKTSRAAIRLLRFNMTCLQEMSIAWSWSLRAIRSLQILAEEWSVNERLHAQNGRGIVPEQPVGTETTGLGVGTHALISEPGFGNNVAPIDATPQALYETSPENIDWLMSFDSGFSDMTMDFAYFDTDLWEMGIQ